jgi:uncharacterized OsmC-like protein
MDRQALLALQAPLKERYQAQPDTALITLKAEGRLGEAITCDVRTASALATAGLHPATGGDGFAACSGDMLLQALVACAGVTLRSIAVNREIPLEGGRISAEGELDFRGTMGVDREAPVGFRSITLSIELEPELDDEMMEKLITATERYCVVLQTIARGTPVSLSHPPRRKPLEA